MLFFSRYALAHQSGYDCDVFIAGAGTGGVPAALAALARGMRVVMTEETDWIGGQLTAQAIPPDEHPYIESFGCNRRYRQYRDGVRNYYRTHYPLTPAAAADTHLNPGNGGVSNLCVEFRVALAVLEAMLAPYLGSGQLTLLLRHVPESAAMAGKRIREVLVRDLDTGSLTAVRAKYFLDSTDLGDLLPMTNTAFVTGTESQAQTGELHATATANPASSQGFTYCFAIDHLAGEDHTIDKPADYAFWRAFTPRLIPAYPGPQLGWTIPVPTASTKGWTQYMQPNPDAAHDTWGNTWFYRRIADRRNFTAGAYRSDITLVNWFQNDYSKSDLLTATPDQRKKYLNEARQLSLSLLYWMQTEAPRLDGGTGFSGLRLRRDIVGDTADGLAKQVYIREGRRLRALFTVTEKHVGTQMRMAETGKSKADVRAAVFADSVGVGAYKLDLHPTSGGANTIDLSAVPFQVPLGALLPMETENLIAAGGKCLGTTHLSNAAYRTHVVEWAIGEAAGAIAAQAIMTGQSPRAIRENTTLFADFQASLRKDGFELEWPSQASALDW